MKLVAIVNQKGGVGKTTTAVNLTAALHSKGARVLLVDFDPQANATSGLGVSRHSKYTSYDVIINGVPAKDAIVHTDWGDVLPSSSALAGAGVELADMEQREFILKKALEPVEQQYDYIFIDCPPHLGVLTQNALEAANKVIIPSKAEYLSYRGIRAIKRTIANIQNGGNPSLNLVGFIITMFEKIINDQRDMLEQFKKEAPVLGIVKKSADAYRSILDGTPVVLSDKKSEVARAYREIAEKL